MQKIHPVFACLAACIVGHYGVHGLGGVEQGIFVVSLASHKEPWCLTVDTGDVNLKAFLRPCDLQNKPTTQRWLVEKSSQPRSGDKNGTIINLRSVWDTNKFLILDKSRNDPVLRSRLHIASYCSPWWDWCHFEYAGFGQLKVVAPRQQELDEDYCLTNQGFLPNTTDLVVVKACRPRKDFSWVFTQGRNNPFPSLPIVETRDVPPHQMIIASNKLCLSPERNPYGRRAVLQDCRANTSVWRFEAVQDIAGGFVLHSPDSDDECLDTNEDTLKKSFKLSSCNVADQNQVFFLGHDGVSLHLASMSGKCMMFYILDGTDSSPVVMASDCGETAKETPWSFLPVDVYDGRNCRSEISSDFVLENQVPFGDMLTYTHSFRSCGRNCYHVNDGGSDPPNLYAYNFAYKRVESFDFTLTAKVCIETCGSVYGEGADAGLMVRETLEEESDTLEESGASFSVLGGRLNGADIEWDCSWYSLRREGDMFYSQRAEVGNDDCAAEWSDVSSSEVPMAQHVFVGFRVGTWVESGYGGGDGDDYEDYYEWRSCLTTAARFEYVECQGC